MSQREDNWRFAMLYGTITNSVYVDDFFIFRRGYIQQTDNKPTRLKAESICLDVRPCKKVTKQS